MGSFELGAGCGLTFQGQAGIPWESQAENIITGEDLEVALWCSAAYQLCDLGQVSEPRGARFLIYQVGITLVVTLKSCMLASITARTSFLFFF